jgi:hypothetical protein
MLSVLELCCILGVFAGLVHPDQPADPLSKYYSSTSRYSISLSQNQPISAKFQTSEQAVCRERQTEQQAMPCR